MGKGQGGHNRISLLENNPGIRPRVDERMVSYKPEYPWGGTEYDEQKALAWHLNEQPVTPGAVRVELKSLEELAEIIKRDPEAAVVISDVHGQLELLKDTLKRLELIDDKEARIRRAELIQLGDLIDGRCAEDYDTILWASQGERFDHFLAGNHEAALMGGGHFSGQPGITPPEIADELKRLTSPYNLRLRVAHQAHGVLITHAGIGSYFTESPEELVESLNLKWEEFLTRNSRQDDLLFGVGYARGGTKEHGGCLWEDFSELVKRPYAQAPQIVGHTPLGGVESDPEGRVVAIDTGGARLGVAVITSDGKITCGSSIVPKTT